MRGLLFCFVKPQVINNFSFWTTFSVDKIRKRLVISTLTFCFG